MEHAPEEHTEEKYLPTDLPKEIPDHLKTTSPNYNQVKILLSWSAHGRPYIQRGKQFFMTALLIAFLIEIILFFFSQYLLMAVVASLVFMGFAFSLVPPRNFHYKISSEGITVENHFYLWRELYDFYFIRKEGMDILHVRTVDFLPGELIITLGDIHKNQVLNAMLPYLPFREYVEPDFMEKSGEWLINNFPLERPR